MDGMREVLEELRSMRLEMRELRERIMLLEHGKQEDTLKKEVISKFNRNKKDIIKQRIFDLMDRFSIAEIKDIIVDQKKYCSKATFYRYVEELKKEQKPQESYI